MLIPVRVSDESTLPDLLVHRPSMWRKLMLCVRLD
jgi:hypothetical protein